MALLGDPERMLRAADAPAGGPGRLVARILGVRHVCQAAAVALFPERSVRRGSRWVDEAHGLSMVGLAAASEEYRGAALLSAAMAAALVLLAPREAG
ncbi:MAG TPA: hypothetical protein VFP55_00790 [Solirubrobacteraceae bacterium]|nr:hypothetical protein [Solirubrobacteraceae bacterium]